MRVRGVIARAGLHILIEGLRREGRSDRGPCRGPEYRRGEPARLRNHHLVADVADLAERQREEGQPALDEDGARP